MTLSLEWLANARGIMRKIEETQLENIKNAATAMADSIEKKQMGAYIRLWTCHDTRRGNVSAHRWLCRISSNGRATNDFLHRYNRTDGNPSVLVS